MVHILQCDSILLPSNPCIVFLPCHRTAWLRVRATSWGVSEPQSANLPKRHIASPHARLDQFSKAHFGSGMLRSWGWNAEFTAIKLQEEVSIVHAHVQHAGHKSWSGATLTLSSKFSVSLQSKKPSKHTWKECTMVPFWHQDCQWTLTDRILSPQQVGVHRIIWPLSLYFATHQLSLPLMSWSKLLYWVKGVRIDVSISQCFPFLAIL